MTKVLAEQVVGLLRAFGLPVFSGSHSSRRRSCVLRYQLDQVMPCLNAQLDCPVKRSATRCLQIDVKRFYSFVHRNSCLHLSVYTQGKQAFLL